MVVPMAVLGIVCVAFGVFAYRLPVRLLLPTVAPVLRPDLSGAAWQPGVATALLCAALVVGGLIYLLGALSTVREDRAYIGGEVGKRAEPFRFSGVEFYRTVRRVPSLHTLYLRAEQGWYDLYRLGQRLVSWVGLPLRTFHSGLLLTYVAWCVLGLVVLLWLFLH